MKYMKIKLGVFFGGKSVEHEVSIITALQAIENINKEKYDVVPVYITKSNKMYTGENITKIEEYKNIDNLINNSKQVTLVQKDNKVVLLNCNKKFLEKDVIDYIDIAFPIVHGTNVEDGTLQGYLKMFNIPYVGCDVLSSACGMDKYICKCILKENNIPVIDGKCYSIKEYNDNPEDVIKDIEKGLGLPVIVKPVNLGSSVGIGIAKDITELKSQMKESFTYANIVLVEKLVKNLREINCSVVGDYENVEASECEEPIKSDEILSFKDKYINGNKKGASKLDNNRTMNAVGLKLPAEITKEQRDTIQELSKKTFKALGCTGVIRIDFILDKDTEKIYVNEVNNIPGSLSFHLWRATGVEYTDLLDKLINLALKRNREEQDLVFSFESNILEGFANNSAKSVKLNK